MTNNGDDKQTARKRWTDAELLDKQPPVNLDAERGVVGSLLLMPETVDDVAPVLRPADFYDQALGRVYAHLVAMRDAGQAIDTALLVERLKTAGELDAIGGVPYVSELLQAVPHAAHAHYYALVVRDKAVLRALVRASTESLQEAYDPTSSPAASLAHAEQRIFAISEGRLADDVVDAADVVVDVVAAIADGRQREGLATGFPDLDQITGGLHAGEVFILAARPSMGKTALALNVAEHVAIKTKTHALFASLEMRRDELVRRLLSGLGRIDATAIRDGKVLEINGKHLVEAQNTIAAGRLSITDRPGLTASELAAMARRLKRRDNLGLVIVDYLQLLEPDNPKDNRQEQVAKLSRRLKHLALDVDVPVLALSQLNRQTEMQANKRPTLANLRESGGIEQDADVVAMLHREGYYDSTAPDNEAELAVKKNRTGPTGKVSLVWRREYTRFESAARPHRYSP